ncbi:MAG: anaerobic ribonucleoside-triphosphate reductase activating protein, partial [Nanoarchaeota archaeon]|nr:anaerobic ribonucleoside-triphosphate reductase activating protein [Nanoarchaeota archaeon]
MKIAGLQKTTLIDYPGEVACTIFLFGCNFRCGFCHNPELVIQKFEEDFSEKKILDFLNRRKGKLDAVCISGGEPLMSLDLDFVRKIKNLGYKVKVDTNGSFPEKLKQLIEEDLIDAVAMDVKASRENYSKVAGVKVDIEKIEESIGLISNLGNYEFRTTVVRRFHDVSEMKAIGRWLNEVCRKKPRKFFLQGFKSKSDLIDKSFSKEKDVSEDYLDGLKKG